MILRVPSYYKEFRCIADKCKDSCCIGWGIDIDEDTRTYYSGIEGTFGKRLRDALETDEEGVVGFKLREDGWCPFLNEKKLCEICITLGEEALSEVCTEYPRFTMEYGNVREKCLCLSCEEVGRLLFSEEENVTFEEYEIADAWQEEEDTEREMELGGKLEDIRNETIKILENREKSIFTRMAEVLTYCKEAQKQLFGGAPEEEEKADIGTPYEHFSERMRLFEELEPFGETWGDLLAQMKQTFSSAEVYDRLHREFWEMNRLWEYTYEKLMVYFLFRYFMRAVYDDNLFGKVQFAVLSVLAIIDLDVWRANCNGGTFSLKDRIETAALYAKEVEHSEENVDLLMEDIWFEDIFAGDSLRTLVLNYNTYRK